jgi:glycosyltransferase involved in cell wall biosynthesis
VFYYVEKEGNGEKVNTAVAANWGVNKNPMLFLKAVKELSQEQQDKLHVDWIGDGELMPEVFAFIKEQLPDLDVAFHGVQPKSYIAPILQNADFLTHPTNAENLPCIIIESLCCGTPVISNDVNGVPELIDKSNGLLAPAGDVESFRNILAYMVKHSGNYNREAIANRAWELYSIESIGRSIFRIYQEALGLEATV